MVIVAQLVRAPDCGSGGRGFESPHSPINKRLFVIDERSFFYDNILIIASTFRRLSSYSS